MKTVYVTIKIVLEDEVDVEEFVSELDYTITYPGLVETEIVDCEE